MSSTYLAHITTPRWIWETNHRSKYDITISAAVVERGLPMGEPLICKKKRPLNSRVFMPKQMPSPQSSSNAIYRIPCNDCPQSYVGETGRTIATRVLEHERNIRSHDRKSLLYQHSHEFNHSFNLRNTIPVYSEVKNKYQRLVLEALVSNSIPRLRHQRKLDFWRMKHGFPSPPQSLPKDIIVNLTDTELSAPQISLLKKGLNLCLPKKPDLLYTVSCIEASLQHQALTDKHHIRSTITGKLLADSKKSFSLPCAVKRDLTTLKTLKNQRDTIITRSDKGSQVVLMKAEDYSKKMLNILSDPNTFQEISADRVKAISGNYRASLRSLLKKGCITPEQFKLFTSNISSIPYIYGLPKTHKPDIPLRPIVAYHLSPALHLARYLSNFLKPLVKAHNIYSIKDSSDFIAKLKNFSQSGSPTMSTFDVTSLFLSLPHSLIFDGLGSLLNSPSVSYKDQKVVFELFNICLGMNTLEFNGRFFLQIRGSPMGSPLSTTAAEIVMSYLDRWLVSQIHLGVVMWARYVDDTFCLHQSTDHSPILTVLNSYHSDLRFTHNSSRFNFIPFLDVLVVNLQGRFHTTVFRKAGFTPSYLHFSSHAPVSHKITTVKTLSKRVFTHCSLPLFSRIEKRIVYLHLLSAGYPRNFIDRHFYSPNHDSSIPPPFKDVCVLPFSTTNSDIGFYLRKFGIRTFFKKSPSLGTSLRHPLTKSSVRPSPQSSSNAIYRIPCNDCPQSYVGETGRTIATRVLEHERNIRSHDRKSLLYQHSHEFNHSFNLRNTIPVYSEVKNKYQRLVLEALVSNSIPSFNRKIDLPPQYTAFSKLGH
ncbi:hypothetical protein LAZ67_1008033 [Cordylochernes scorpioides]|uniref:Reverse transcriptase domain-containing protein n=1 Tax=Cordylochernes scorpioides TaxID=51811 RepID=A0ABY6K1G3_9ARAC|nr:hypothetical protein LAZ67_1008033 [Cordylochernes scorpioides]